MKRAQGGADASATAGTGKPAGTGAPLAEEEAFWAAHPGEALAGVDEAGRGPLAGPVTAGAVSIAPEHARALRAGALAGLTDSKQLTAAQREAYYGVLTTDPDIRWAVGEVSPAEIDRLNILRAAHLAMKRALESLPGGLPAFALVDGLPVRGLPIPHQPIVKGDSHSFLIAAASILAKVTRDRIMDTLDDRYPGYGFRQHKGYPTPAHLAALQLLGPCPEHRRTFGPVVDVLNPPFL